MSLLANHWPEVPKVKNFNGSGGTGGTLNGLIYTAPPPPPTQTDDGRGEAIEAVSELLRGVYDDLGKLKSENDRLKMALELKIRTEETLDTRNKTRTSLELAWTELFGPEVMLFGLKHLKERIGL